MYVFNFLNKMEQSKNSCLEASYYFEEKMNKIIFFCVNINKMTNIKHLEMKINERKKAVWDTIYFRDFQIFFLNLIIII